MAGNNEITIKNQYADIDTFEFLSSENLIEIY